MSETYDNWDEELKQLEIKRIEIENKKKDLEEKLIQVAIKKHQYELNEKKRIIAEIDIELNSEQTKLATLNQQVNEYKSSIDWFDVNAKINYLKSRKDAILDTIKKHSPCNCDCRYKYNNYNYVTCRVCGHMYEPE